MLPDTNPSRTGRRILKRLLYSQLSFRNAFLIMLGKVQPSIPFTVLADPSAIYYNFKVKDDRLEDFERYINLSTGFKICPIKCLANEEGDYLLTLNVYEVTGIAVGIRAEWSTYIKDKHGKPRYMVLEAQSSEYSMDPIDVITKKGRVEHTMGKGNIITTVASKDENLFEASINLTANLPKIDIHGDWIEANDYIYWRNGICDRTFYDAGLANPNARLIDKDDVKISDQTHWAQFLEPAPKHVIQFLDPLDFMIVPWSNL